MKSDDVVYLLLLVSSVGFGFVVRRIRSPFLRQTFCGLLGFAMAIYICKWQIWHSLFVATVTYLITKTAAGPKWGHLLSFTFNFGFLAFFRLAHYFDVEYPSPHTNAIQLLLTLKMISVASDVSEPQTENPDDVNMPYSPLGQNNPLDDLRATPPTLYEFFCYTYCYIGLFTGPFYQFKLYRHMIYRNDSMNISTSKHVAWRIVAIVVLGALFLYFQSTYPIEYGMTREFLEYPLPFGFFYRYFYLVVWFLAFRLRFYIGWLLAEASCIAATLGAYPSDSAAQPGRGPTRQTLDENDVDFAAAKNQDIFKIETAVTMQMSIKYWNMSVQTWMVYYVYKRLPWRRFRYWGVFLVSAFWHGIHPGYYLCLLSTTLFGAMEARVSRLGGRLWDDAGWVAWVGLYLIGELYRTHAFEYVGLGFIFLRMEPTIAIWRADYFHYHVFGVVALLVAFLVPVRKEKREKKD